jgi:hypothetical protein
LPALAEMQFWWTAAMQPTQRGIIASGHIKLELKNGLKISRGQSASELDPFGMCNEIRIQV